jgi:hypothetical protein
MPEHTVKTGDCITSIADEHGFFWRTVWDHEKNAQLRSLRRDPNTLLSSDVVHVPEKRVKTETRSTGAAHRFRLKGIPAMFRLQLFRGHEPRAGESFTLTVDGVKHEGTTSAAGLIEVPIPADARKATLVVASEEEELRFLLGRLPPISEIMGVQARLNNLGFDCGGVSGELDEKARDALRAFQERVGIEVDGEPNDETREALEKWHDEINRLPDPGERAWAEMGPPEPA